MLMYNVEEVALLLCMVCSINCLEACAGLFHAILQDAVFGWHFWLVF